MRTILLLILCYSFQAIANEPPKCPDYRKFDVYVQNNSEQVCELLSQTLRRGYPIEVQKHFRIQPNEKLLVYRTDDFAFQGSDVVLNYQCGPNKFVTIESERDVWAGDQQFVKGWIWSIAGMNTNYLTAYGDCDTNQSASIVWTFF
jgi:hypothetical protein